jgi:hypothetical protein
MEKRMRGFALTVKHCMAILILQSPCFGVVDSSVSSELQAIMVETLPRLLRKWSMNDKGHLWVSSQFINQMLFTSKGHILEEYAARIAHCTKRFPA